MIAVRPAGWGILALGLALLLPSPSDACFKPTPPADPPPMVCFNTGIIPGTTTTQVAIALGAYFGTTTQNCSCGVSFAGPAVPIPVGARIAVVDYNTCTINVALTAANLGQFYSGGASILARQPGADSAWASGVDMMGGTPMLPGATWFGFGGQPSSIVPPGGLPVLPSPNLKYALVFDLGTFSLAQTSQLRLQIGSGGGTSTGGPNFTPSTQNPEVAIYGGIVPEPPSVMLMGLAAAGLFGTRLGLLAWSRRATVAQTS